MFGREIAYPRAVGNLIEEYLLNLVVGEEGKFLWSASVCVILWFLWGGRNNSIFRGVERDSRILVSYSVSRFTLGFVIESVFVIIPWVLSTLVGILFCNVIFSGLGFCGPCNFFVLFQ